MEINKIPVFKHILGNKKNTILKPMPFDSVSFTASKSGIKNDDERIKDLEERNLSPNSCKIMMMMQQENYDKALSLIDSGIAYENAIEIAKYDDERYDIMLELINQGCPHRFAIMVITCGLQKIDDLMYDYPEFLASIDPSYKIEYEDLQNNAGYRIVAQKTFDNKEEKVTKKVIIDNKGNLSKNTIYQSGNLIQSFEHGKDKSTIIIGQKSNPKYKEHDILLRQIDIINDESGQPHHIITTKCSNCLLGAYEITKYVLSDYPEDMDMVGLFMNLALDDKIEELGLKPGEKLSKTYTNPDDSVTCLENYTYNGKEISKKYTEHVDSEYDVDKLEYSYEINNEDGSKLLKMDRSWKRNEDGTTTTIINGKEYIAEFNDENQSVSITKPDGTLETISIGNKCEEKSKERFWNFAKTLPADILLPIKHLRTIEVSDTNSGVYLAEDYLEIQTQPQLMAHEMGHVIDWEGMNLDYLGKYNGNKDLLKIYNKEMEKFNAENPTAAQDIILYFSQTGGSRSTGLSEIVAEVLTLMTSFGHIDETLSARINYLTRYFPETVAKTASLLGYNQVE